MLKSGYLDYKFSRRSLRNKPLPGFRGCHVGRRGGSVLQNDYTTDVDNIKRAHTSIARYFHDGTPFWLHALRNSRYSIACLNNDGPMSVLKLHKRLDYVLSYYTDTIRRKSSCYLLLT